MPDPSILIPVALIVLVASVAKGTTGFGFALMASPFLLLIWEPLSIVPILTLLALIQDVLITVQARRSLQFKQVLPMIVASIFGIPLGNYVLLVVSRQVLTLTIATVAIAFAILMFSGYTAKIRRERIAGSIAGFISGILMTSTAVSGPPVALLMINKQQELQSFRANLAMFFLVNELMAITSLAVSGVLTIEAIKTAGALIPAVLTGYWLGTLALPHIKQALFLRVATTLVITAAGLAIVSEVVKF